MATKKVIKLYKVEVGVLLPKDDDEYKDYSQVYDKKHAYYDENVVFFTNKRNAIRFLNHYVANGVVNTYGILSELNYVPKEIYGDDYEQYTNDDIESIKSFGCLENYIDIFGSENYDVTFVTMNKYKLADKKYAKIF